MLASVRCCKRSRQRPLAQVDRICTQGSLLCFLCPQVDHLAKKMNTGSNSGATDNNMQLEQLTCTNRQQAAQIHSLSQAAAQREALIGQLQAQLATARLHDQQLQQQVQAEREQHQQVARQVSSNALGMYGLWESIIAALVAVGGCLGGCGWASGWACVRASRAASWEGRSGGLIRVPRNGCCSRAASHSFAHLHTSRWSSICSSSRVLQRGHTHRQHIGSSCCA